MAIALHQHPTRLRHANHLRLVSPVDPTPVAPRRPRVATRTTYLRRRLLVMLALFVVMFGAIFATRTLASHGGPANSAMERYVIAQEGDHLWSIAERISPTGNIPDIVDQLAALNGTSLRVGQVVLIP